MPNCQPPRHAESLYIQIFLCPSVHQLGRGHLIGNRWKITWWRFNFSGSALAGSSSIAEWNKSACLSTQEKTLSVKKMLTLQRQTISGVFFCCHPDVMRGGRCCTEKNDQRSGCFGLDTSFYLWLQPMVKLQRDGGRTKETNFNREYGNKATTMKDWKLFFLNSFSASRLGSILRYLQCKREINWKKAWKVGW